MKGYVARTQVANGYVVAGSVDVAPVDVRDSFAVADHVATDQIAVVGRHPSHHHGVGEGASSHVARLAGN